MNMIAAADKPLLWRMAFFVFVLLATGRVTMFTIAKSKRLADFLDALSDDRVALARQMARAATARPASALCARRELASRVSARNVYFS